MRVWIDGELKAPEDAVIGVFDRAVLFGESVYEGVRICRGTTPMLPRHRRRLARGLAALGLDPSLAERLDEATRDLLAADPIADGLLYLQVTGGGVPGVRRHARGAAGPARVFAFVTPCAPVAETPAAVSAIRREDRRWSGCGVKTTNLLANVQALTEASEHDAEEAILIANGIASGISGGRVSEGAHTSVFAVVDGVLHTTPIDASRSESHDESDRHSSEPPPPILPGVTREVLCERLAASGRVLRETALASSRLDDASEVMILSSRRLLSSVTRLDGVPVGEGVPGPVAGECLDLLRAAFLDPTPTNAPPSPTAVPAHEESRP